MFEISGDSMRFLLRTGDWVRVRPVQAEGLSPGDLVVFLKDRMNPVAHRLLWAGASRLRTKGDAALWLDVPIPASGVIGKVVAVRRGGSWRRLDTAPGRLRHCALGLLSWAFFATPYPERLRVILERLWHLGREAYFRSRDALREAYFRSRDALREAYFRTRDALREAYFRTRDTLREAYFRTRDTLREAYFRTRGALREAYLRSRDRARDACYRSRNAVLEALERWAARARDIYYRSRDRVLEGLERGSAALLHLWRLSMGRFEACWREGRRAAMAEAHRCREASFHALRRGGGLAYGLLPRHFPIRAFRRAILRVCAALETGPYGGGRIDGDVLWEGEVLLREDVVVPPGARLRIAAGTTVLAPGPCSSENAWVQRTAFGGRKLLTRPGSCHLLVLGRLEVHGRPGEEVRFGGAGWAGIILLGSGRAWITRARMEPSGAFALTCADFSRARLAHVGVRGGWGAAACLGAASVALRSCSSSAHERAALWSHDIAAVSALGCRIAEGGIGLRSEGASRVRWARGRCEGQRGPGARLRQAARLGSRRSLWRGNAVGLLAEGRSRVVLQEDDVLESASGLCAREGAEIRAEDITISSGAVESGGRASPPVIGGCVAGGGKVGVFIGERARAVLARGRVERLERGIEVVAAGSALLEGVLVQDNETGAWIQNSSRLEVREGRWSSNGTGVRASHSSRLRVTGAVLAAQAEAAVQAEDGAAAELNGVLLEDNPSGLRLDGSSRARMSGCRASGNQVGAWARGRSRLRVEGGGFCSNRAGIKAEEAASLSVDGARFVSNSEAGLVVSGEAQALASRAAFSGSPAGAAVLGRGRLRLEDGVFCGNAAGLRLQDAARLRSRGGLWRSNEVGLSAEGRSTAALRGGAVLENAVAGLRARDAAAVRWSGGLLSSQGIGAELAGCSRASLRGARIQGNGTGVWAREQAAVVLRGGRAAGNGTGLRASQGARLSLGSVLIESNRDVGVFAEDRAVVEAAGGGCRSNPVAWQGLGSSRLSLEEVRLEGNGEGVWAQNASRAELRGVRCECNVIGVKSSHESRVSLRCCDFQGQGKSGVFVEDSALARVVGARFRGNENGVLALHGSAAELGHCVVRGCADTGVWADHRSRVTIAATAFGGNRVDRHTEHHPAYG